MNRKVILPFVGLLSLSLLAVFAFSQQSVVEDILRVSYSQLRNQVGFRVGTTGVTFPNFYVWSNYSYNYVGLDNQSNYQYLRFPMYFAETQQLAEGWVSGSKLIFSAPNNTNPDGVETVNTQFYVLYKEGVPSNAGHRYTYLCCYDDSAGAYPNSTVLCQNADTTKITSKVTDNRPNGYYCGWNIAR